MLIGAIDYPDREHEIARRTVLLVPRAAEEPVDQVVDGDGLG
ncbi:hypothetical protein CAB90_01979 [Mycobacterium tuberculosis]|uniref:Uncharacterized protein n=1 Tax=Mycobacterium tuberculosis TaxID=1773 RepID=A0A2I7W7I3_MYCTX|nr:hypothetical protein CAB90_01979 [Mycobacterium tuberculosis]